MSTPLAIRLPLSQKPTADKPLPDARARLIDRLKREARDEQIGADQR